jgi:hypothetical protein
MKNEIFKQGVKGTFKTSNAPSIPKGTFSATFISRAALPKYMQKGGATYFKFKVDIEGTPSLFGYPGARARQHSMKIIYRGDINALLVSYFDPRQKKWVNDPLTSQQKRFFEREKKKFLANKDKVRKPVAKSTPKRLPRSRSDTQRTQSTARRVSFSGETVTVVWGPKRKDIFVDSLGHLKTRIESHVSFATADDEKLFIEGYTITKKPLPRFERRNMRGGPLIKKKKPVEIKKPASVKKPKPRRRL